MPEESKPLVREDIKRLIRERGGTAKGLDLPGADMRGKLLGFARSPSQS